MASFCPQICIKSIFGRISAQTPQTKLTTLPQNPLSNDEGVNLSPYPLPSTPSASHLGAHRKSVRMASRAPLWLSRGLH